MTLYECLQHPNQSYMNNIWTIPNVLYQIRRKNPLGHKALLSLIECSHIPTNLIWKKCVVTTKKESISELRVNAIEGMFLHPDQSDMDTIETIPNVL